MKESNIETTTIKEAFVLFQTNCMCLHPDHCVTVCVEDDGPGPNDEKLLSVSLFFKCCWYDSYHDNWFRKILRRIKSAAKLLFRGYLELEESFTFRDKISGTPNHLRDFRNALEEAIKHVEETSKKD